MIHETSFVGMFFPSLVLCALLAAIAWFLLDWLLLKIAVWRFFWHPPLARLSLYFVLFAAVAATYPNF